MNRINLIGMVFGRLTVVSVAPDIMTSNRALSVFTCTCSCGTTKDIRAASLTSGLTRSCGCLHRESCSNNGKTNSTTHGKSYTKVYLAWVNMKRRCYNKAHKSYHQYGGRGITVDQSWLASFETFLEDMGEPPSSSHSLDRIDNMLGYEKNNCRWASREQQVNNRRVTKYITIDGVTKCVADWCRDKDINLYTYYSRVHRGWDAQSALLTPVKGAL